MALVLEDQPDLLEVKAQLDHLALQDHEVDRDLPVKGVDQVPMEDPDQEDHLDLVDQADQQEHLDQLALQVMYKTCVVEL